MHFDVAVRNPARHFLADDHIVALRVSGEQLQRAIDRIVIGDGDEIHAARLRDAVDILRRGVAVAAAEKGQRAADAGRMGVHVKIGAQGRHQSERFQQHDLQSGRAEVVVPVRQEALADIGAQNGIPRRAKIQRQPDSGQPLPVAAARFVAPPGVLDEGVQPVLVEDIDGIGAPRHGELGIADARPGTP